MTNLRRMSLAIAVAGSLLGCMDRQEHEAREHAPSEPSPETESFPMQLESIAGTNSSLIPEPRGFCRLVEDAHFIGHFEVAAIVGELGDDLWGGRTDQIARTAVTLEAVGAAWKGTPPEPVHFLMPGGHLANGGFSSVDHSFELDETVILFIELPPTREQTYSASQEGVLRIADDVASGEYLFGSGIGLAELRSNVVNAIAGNCVDVRPDHEARRETSERNEPEPAHEEDLDVVED